MLDLDECTVCKFASIHASFHNLFNSQRSLSKRSTFKLNRDAALTGGALYHPIEFRSNLMLGPLV